ncbi:TRAP transporter small permease [Marinomonas pollencensis]|uniref:TRAP transporter small permease protein n=1 Tax=Marinomonas pollencensis TaxID=491954 RepID=A0A3E0DR73_9GAMM|nr:TRAP transporter small permease [Marinomonas pollencensis]REG85637.1 TRAP-type C4-dicarboxylate transport system permease small subunit [Marinomonas pollencensis]
MRQTSKIFTLLYKHGVETLAGSMFIVILSLSWLQVFRRYALDNSSTWTEEVARLLLVWLTFLAAAAATRDESHLAVDILINRLPNTLKHAFRCVVNLLIASVGVVLCWKGVIIVELAMPDHSTSLGFSRALFYLPAVAGGALIIFYSLVNAFQHCRALQHALTNTPPAANDDSR